MLEETSIEKRIKKLETHLKGENDFLAEIIPTFRELDKVAYRLGLLKPDEHSYITRIAWWPVVSILGTFSAGKSTFINYYLGKDLQRTGNQAVDDKFTVICFGGEQTEQTTLPGTALDADDRFPFYEISHDIAHTTGQPHRVDSYLQMKTCASEKLRGKILIDSPGFDADEQRTDVLRKVTQYMIDLSDLVLVFFDARHAEPGAMRDTLSYLVTSTLERPDANKFLYILNQIDVTAKEDNPEEVTAAWQRSLAHAGLTTGRFYRIYNPNVAMPIDDPKIRERFERKCGVDMTDIQNRMEQVSIERAYRITGMLETTTREIEDKVLPKLRELIQRWKTRTLWAESSLLLSSIMLLIAALFATQSWQTVTTYITGLNTLTLQIGLGILLILAIFIHRKITRWSANSLMRQVKKRKEIPDEYLQNCILRAFEKNTHFWRSLFIWLIHEPVGWKSSTHNHLQSILANINHYVQNLNNRFTNPSGKNQAHQQKEESKDTISRQTAAG